VTASPWKALRAGVLAAVVVGLAIALAVGIYVSLTNKEHHASPKPHPTHLGLPARGIDYYEPSSYYSLCPDWTWLETHCFDPAHPPSPSQGEPGRFVLNSDLSFVRTAGLGRLMRLWISTDQLPRWARNGRLASLRADRIRNLDRALAIFRRQGLSVDLVLFAYSADSGNVNQMNPAALDGNHPALRSSYLQALRLILRHLVANGTDAATVRIVDLQNEPYYQLEQFFNTPNRLGRFGGCALSARSVSSQCVDQRIVHPWLVDLYRTARSVTHRFLLTESDTGRLLSTNLKDQRYWIAMYPVDLYDIHMYEATPWFDQKRWTSAGNLTKPWFAGEVGCASGQATCTYSGSLSAPIDRWWLQNLPRFGAQSVLLESKTTLWTYRAATPSQTLTETGLVLQCQSRPSQAACSSLP